MKTNILSKISQETIQSIKKIDFSKLDISDYNKNYITNLLPHINYYFKIYSDVINRLLEDENLFDYVVDFGGGHGFLSLFLKQLGMNVIYCDHNPLSVKTITTIKKEIGFGPDIIIEGSSSELLSFCKTHTITPKYLIATDLIEHVYDLNSLFADFQKLNPNLSMIFTTGSVKSNILKSIRLRKYMKKEETEVYFPARKLFLSEKYPELTFSEIKKLSSDTRGLIFPDIEQYISNYLKKNILPTIDVDKYNTCNPKTGNWTERILSKKQYRKIINAHDFQVSFGIGFYNDERSNYLISLIAKIVNFLMLHFYFVGLFFCPFLILKVNK